MALFYLMFVHKLRPTVRSAVKSYIALAVMALVAYGTNVYLGGDANYLFLAQLPPLLDILPDITFVRIGVMAAVVTVMYALAYLPWYIKDRKAAKQAAVQSSSC